MNVLLTNGTDRIEFAFPQKLNADFDECNDVIIKIAVANLHYSYQEEFLTQSIIEFLEKCFIHHSEFPILSGIGFSLSINKKDELGHYKAVINIDDDFHKIFLKFEMDLVLTEIKSFVSDLKKLAIR